MKRLVGYLSVLFVVFVMASCSNGKKSVFTPTSSGRPYEIIVVVPENVWEAPAGRALFNVLDTDVPGLPQAERSFRISYTSPQNFDHVLKLIRNIIIVDIQDIYTQAKFKYSRNVYASPQMIMTIQAPNQEAFEQFVTKNGQVIIDFFVAAEMNRQISLLKEKHNESISKKIESMFACNIWLPTELSNSKEGTDFFWASTNTATADMNFVMYSYPYTSKNTFTKEYYLHMRDSFMRANIPGSKEGMYMTTDSSTVEISETGVQGDYTMVVRGLWYVHGDFMGGPFVSHTRLDQANQRIVTAEVFIYSPDKLKRNLMRQMEASLFTLRFPTDKQIDQIPLDIPKE